MKRPFVCFGKNGQSVVSRRISKFLMARGYHVAVIGSGPAGFYCARDIVKGFPDAKVDIYERLPVPYGLLRFGVAPDHPEVKNASIECQRVIQDPRVRWFGNVTIGKALPPSELWKHYSAIVLSYGAESDKRLDVPGEDLKGIFGAREFVEWYNGFPGAQHRSFHLERVRNAVVVGAGNVALDCARILNAPPGLLESTDIVSHALAKLKQAPLKDTFVVARRGPMQAQFTIKEFRELLNLGSSSSGGKDSKSKEDEETSNPKTAKTNQWVNVLIPPADTECIAKAAEELKKNRAKKRLNELILTASRTAPNPSLDRRIHFKFFRAPVRFIGDEHGHVKELVVGVTEVDAKGNAKPTGVEERIPCDLVLRSVGYQSTPIAGFPFHAKLARMQTSADGRVMAASASSSNPEVVRGLYACGWVGTGPVGVVASTIAGAGVCARTVVQDLQQGVLTKDNRNGHVGVLELLKANKIPYLVWDDWLRIEQEEKKRGAVAGKSAEKLVDLDELVRYSSVKF